MSNTEEKLYKKWPNHDFDPSKFIQYEKYNSDSLITEAEEILSFLRSIPDVFFEEQIQVIINKEESRFCISTSTEVLGALNLAKKINHLYGTISKNKKKFMQFYPKQAGFIQLNENSLVDQGTFQSFVILTAINSVIAHGFSNYLFNTHQESYTDKNGVPINFHRAPQYMEGNSPSVIFTLPNPDADKIIDYDTQLDFRMQNRKYVKYTFKLCTDKIIPQKPSDKKFTINLSGDLEVSTKEGSSLYNSHIGRPAPWEVIPMLNKLISETNNIDGEYAILTDADAEQKAQMESVRAVIKQTRANEIKKQHDQPSQSQSALKP